MHSAMLSPDEKYLFAADLGTDQLNIFRYRASKNPPLFAEAPMSVVPGNGPRHLVFSADGKFLYLLQEMGAVITAYSVDGGKLKALQSVNMTAQGFRGTVGAADIHISPDGRFLYASNRGDANEMVVYAISPENGLLTFVDRSSTLGKTPRIFAIDPTGSYLLVANQNSDSITIFKIDKVTGKLSPTRNKIDINMPVCLKFVPLEE